MPEINIKFKQTLSFLVGITIIFFMFSCESNYTPKPRGYFRIDFPEKKYIPFDSTFPYRFERPVYTSITDDPISPEEKYWINLNFLPFKATVHFSYKKVNGNLITYLEDSHKMVSKHIPKADAIYDSLVIDRKNNVFGLIYKIEGSGAASPYQFFLTDSISNFVRGALYFNTVPNNDSLEPVINFITDDIEHLIKTFRWKNIGQSEKQ
jgi:gliding motility-associated lipoprotein GldD